MEYLLPVLSVCVAVVATIVLLWSGLYWVFLPKRHAKRASFYFFGAGLLAAISWMNLLWNT